MDDFRGASFLYTLATLMVTFAGFSALLLTVRQAIGARLSVLDRFLTRTTVGHSLVLTGGALLPALLKLYALPEIWIWKISAVIFGLFYLALLLTFPRRRMAITGRPPPLVIAVTFVGLGAASLVFMIAWILADFAQPAAVYVTTVTVNFFTLALAFVVALEVILRQPVDEASGHQEPD